MNIAKKYDHLFSYEEITETLKEYERQYPEYFRVTSLGTTDEGRELWMAEITDTGTGGYDDKPSYAIIGHWHSTEQCGMMESMYFMDVLMSNKDSDPRIKDILNTYTVCIIPTGTPDGMAFAQRGGSARSINKVCPPLKELPNGIYREDIDGDGVVRFMRKKDPNGPWKIDPADPRLMIRREPHDVVGDNDYYSVYNEGMVKGDPEKCCYNAPDPYLLDLNRNFPYDWRSMDVQPKAGQICCESVESQAVCDLMMEKKNMCTILAFHTFSGCTFYPPSAMPPEKCPAKDMQNYVEVGKIVEEVTGYPYCNVHDMSVRDNYPTHGSFEDFAYLGCGIMSYAIELWGWFHRIGVAQIWQLPKHELNSVHNERQETWMKWIDENATKGIYKDWTRFEHPQLGEVEIGGLDTLHCLSNPPLNHIMYEELENATETLIRLIRCLPKIELEKASATKRDDGYYDVEVSVVNARYYPTNMTEQAKKLRRVGEDRVALLGEGVRFVSGKPVETIGHLPGMADVKATGDNTSYWLRWRQVEANGFRKTVKWVVGAKPGTEITISATSDKAGRDSVRLVLE